MVGYETDVGCLHTAHGIGLGEHGMDGGGWLDEGVLVRWKDVGWMEGHWLDEEWMHGGGR